MGVPPIVSAMLATLSVLFCHVSLRCAGFGSLNEHYKLFSFIIQSSQWENDTCYWKSLSEWEWWSCLTPRGPAALQPGHRLLVLVLIPVLVAILRIALNLLSSSFSFSLFCCVQQAFCQMGNVLRFYLVLSHLGSLPSILFVDTQL